MARTIMSWAEVQVINNDFGMSLDKRILHEVGRACYQCVIDSVAIYRETLYAGDVITIFGYDFKCVDIFSLECEKGGYIKKLFLPQQQGEINSGLSNIKKVVIVEIDGQNEIVYQDNSSIYWGEKFIADIETLQFLGDKGLYSDTYWIFKGMIYGDSSTFKNVAIPLNEPIAFNHSVKIKVGVQANIVNQTTFSRMSLVSNTVISYHLNNA